MNYRQIPIYLCSFISEWNEYIQKEGSIVGHNFGKWNGKTLIWPKNIDSKTINPKNFIKLKKELELKEVLFSRPTLGNKGYSFYK